MNTCPIGSGGVPSDLHLNRLTVGNKLVGCNATMKKLESNVVEAGLIRGVEAILGSVDAETANITNLETKTIEADEIIINNQIIQTSTPCRFTVPVDYPTIQEAIDAALSEGVPTVIILCGGTFDAPGPITSPLISILGQGNGSIINGGLVISSSPSQSLPSIRNLTLSNSSGSALHVTSGGITLDNVVCSGAGPTVRLSDTTGMARTIISNSFILSPQTDNVTVLVENNSIGGIFNTQIAGFSGPPPTATSAFPTIDLQQSAPGQIFTILRCIITSNTRTGTFATGMGALLTAAYNFIRNDNDDDQIGSAPTATARLFYADLTALPSPVTLINAYHNVFGIGGNPNQPLVEAYSDTAGRTLILDSGSNVVDRTFGLSNTDYTSNVTS